MITHIRIRNFKTLEHAEFDLGAAPVVLIGPNNCGKTSILQALTMWRVGVREWLENRTGKKSGIPGKLRGVGIPHTDFLALPVPNARLIWHAQEVRKNGRTPINIAIEVEGETKGEPWNIGVEFEYDGKRLIICRPISSDFSRWQEYCPDVAFLQPMSGLADEEDQLRIGSINDRLGKGKTADVLRNICYQLVSPEMPPIVDWDSLSLVPERKWENLTRIMAKKFAVELLEPKFDSTRGKIQLAYKENGKEYDLSSAGRGFHQTLLLLSYIYTHPGSVILLDEPDAHLEIVRQRDSFSLLREVAGEQNSQLIIASHSEIVMNEAAEKGGIISVISGRTESLLGKREISQHKKLLTDIGWDKVHLAKTRGHVLFLEGTTDIDMLAAFADVLSLTDGAEKIRRANIETVNSNRPAKANAVFRPLHSAIPNLRGYALFDRISKTKLRDNLMKMECWIKREIENYLLLPDVLRRYANDEAEKVASGSPLLTAEKEKIVTAMETAINNNAPGRAIKNSNDKFWQDNPMSEYINDVLEEFCQKVKVVRRLWKADFYTLVKYMRPEEIPAEVGEKIKQILAVIGEDENAPQS